MTALGEEYRRRATQDHDIKVQMPVLYAWANRPGVRIIELGIRSGNSTSAFLAGLERGHAFLSADEAVSTRLGGLWSVDIAPPAVPGEWADCPFWHFLIANDVTEQAVSFCPDDAEILFIDTSHYYEHTLAELRLYVPKVRPGGVVLLHDTDPAEWPDVSRALRDYCAESGLEWYDHPFWHGLGVIEIPGA